MHLSFNTVTSADQPAARRDTTVTCLSKEAKKKDLQTSYSSTYPVMGSSASTSVITPTPRKLSLGSQKEDKVKLEDFLTQCEEDLWRVKRKQSLSLKKLHLIRSIRYMDLAAQESDGFNPNGGEVLNPAFVGDQGP